MCQKFSETIDNFLSCLIYGSAVETDWKLIYGNNQLKQTRIWLFIQKRRKHRERVISQQEAGQTSNSSSGAPADVEL